MRNVYLITTSEEYDLEHSLEHASEGQIRSRRLTKNARLNNKANEDFISNQRKKKASAARAAERTAAAREDDYNENDAGFVDSRKRKKAFADRAAERTAAARAGDTTNHSTEIEAKWRKLIAVQEAQIDSLEKKYAQAKKDYDSMARTAYGMQEPNAKKAMQKQLKAKEVQLSGYGSNIRNAKAIIESYKDDMREELAKEAKRYQKAMGTY